MPPFSFPSLVNEWKEEAHFFCGMWRKFYCKISKCKYSKRLVSNVSEAYVGPSQASTAKIVNGEMPFILKSIKVVCVKVVLKFVYLQFSNSPWTFIFYTRIRLVILATWIQYLAIWDPGFYYFVLFLFLYFIFFFLIWFCCFYLFAINLFWYFWPTDLTPIFSF